MTELERKNELFGGVNQSNVKATQAIRDLLEDLDPELYRKARKIMDELSSECTTHLTNYFYPLRDQ